MFGIPGPNHWVQAMLFEVEHSFDIKVDIVVLMPISTFNYFFYLVWKLMNVNNLTEFREKVNDIQKLYLLLLCMVYSTAHKLLAYDYGGYFLSEMNLLFTTCTRAKEFQW